MLIALNIFLAVYIGIGVICVCDIADEVMAEDTPEHQAQPLWMQLVGHLAAAMFVAMFWGPIKIADWWFGRHG